MCIYVTKLPKSKRESTLQIVYKELEYSNVHSRYRTPYTESFIDTNGVLCTDNKNNVELKNNYSYGFIHSYKIKLRNSLNLSYAINIYGENNDDNEVISKFLYIPFLDYSDKKKERVKTLNGILKSNYKNAWRKICNLFPDYINCFDGNPYYIREIKKIIFKDISKNRIQWQKMIKYGQISLKDLEDFVYNTTFNNIFPGINPNIKYICQKIGTERIKKLIKKSLHTFYRG